MPITLLDIILLVVMLVSALLAMVRGFMREVLSIAAWLTAALTTVWAYPRYIGVAKQYFNNDLVATAALVGGVFLGTLIIVSLVTIKISDMVLDSRVGALDRTLGFLFGLGRGLIIVVVAFLFFSWLVPEKTQPEWIAQAKSRVVLQSTGEWLVSLLPDDPETTILKRLRPQRDEEGEQPESESAPSPQQRSGLGNSSPDDQPGYTRAERAGLQNLLGSPAATAR